MTENELYLADANAFPQTIDEVSSGMTLRDYFAAKAMQAMIAYYGAYNEDRNFGKYTKTPNIDEVAQYAYNQANSMMQQRDAIYGFGEENDNI